jgi:hypothetical protein
MTGRRGGKCSEVQYLNLYINKNFYRKFVKKKFEVNY